MKFSYYDGIRTSMYHHHHIVQLLSHFDIKGFDFQT